MDLKFYPNATLIPDADNAVQPDAMLRTSPHQKGSPVRLDNKGYLRGAPELVCEVAAISVAVDSHEKFLACRRNGIQEYLVWLTEKSAGGGIILKIRNIWKCRKPPAVSPAACSPVWCWMWRLC